MVGLIDSKKKSQLAFNISFSWCNLPYQKLWKLSPKKSVCMVTSGILFSQGKS